MQHEQKLEELFRKALEEMVERLKPQRAFIAYRAGREDKLVPICAHGLPVSSVLVTGEISLGLITGVLQTGEAVHTLDAQNHPQLSERTSVVLTGLRSVICAPIAQPSGLTVGVLYADDRVHEAAFKEGEVAWVRELGVWLGRQISDLLQHWEEPDEQELVGWNRIRQKGLEAFGEGRYADALRLLARARDLADSWPGEGPKLCLSLNELAEVHRAQGELDEAEKLLSRALEILERLSRDRHPDAVPCLNNLGGIHFARGNSARAEALYTYCLDILEASGNGRNPRLIAVLNNIGTVCLERGDVEKAARHYRRAVELAVMAFGEHHPAVLRCRERLDECTRASGLRPV
ncbi:MAG: tetratricopeptide repeat protein [Armatimonadetes bacterium]|nr:tetratricopeptide repeat protein [Armatimonadota bacterium]